MFCVVPIGGTVSILGHQTYLQVADLPIGVLFILAMSGIGVYGVMLAGWSSGSKYPLLGSVRASAQLLSYEAAFGLAILGVLIQARHALDARASSTQQALDERGLVRRRDWFWLPALVAVRDLPDRGGRRDEPPAVRPRRGRAGARRRVQHRVHRHPVRDLLPRRVHERHHDVGDRGHAVPRRPVGPGLGFLPGERRGQRVDHADVLVLAEGARAAVRHGVAAGVAAAAALRPADGARVEVPHRDRDPLGAGVDRDRQVAHGRGLGPCSIVVPVAGRRSRSVAYGVLYLAMPKPGEHVEEFR